MAQLFVWVCPSCGKVYNSESTKPQFCPHCGATVVYSGVTKAEFDRKTTEQKQWIISNARSGHVQVTPEKVRDTNVWINLLNGCANLFIVFGVLGSLTGGASIIAMGDRWIGLGILVILGGSLISVVLASATKILISAARDLKFIRNYFESKV